MKGEPVLWIVVPCARCGTQARIPAGQQIQIDGWRMPLCDHCWSSFETWARRDVNGAPAWILRPASTPQVDGG